MFLPTSGHTLESVDGDVVCFGGLVTIPAAATNRPPSAPPGRPPTASGAQPTAALHAYSLADCTWRELQAENDSPPGRSGHACCRASDASLLVFGGADGRHRKLDDVWRLDLRREEKTTDLMLELCLDAWTAERAETEQLRATAAAEAAAAEAAAEAEAATKKGVKGGGQGGPGKMGKEEHASEVEPPKEVLRLGVVAHVIATALGVSDECINVELGASDELAGDPQSPKRGIPPYTAADEDAPPVVGLPVWVRVKPMLGIGLQTLGVDGAQLPAAAMAEVKRRLQMVAPMTPPEAEDAGGGKGGKKEASKGGKGGKKDNSEAAATATARAAAQRRLVGYPVLSWELHTQAEADVVRCVSWTQVQVRGEESSGWALHAGGSYTPRRPGGQPPRHTPLVHSVCAETQP